MAKKTQPTPAPPEEAVEAERQFVESLVGSGQAAKRRPDGSLPPGATHELVEGDDGQMKVVRKRFSAF
ncbi:MAG: hypothetical protein HYV26_22165 [Candidatus Hydrogenedentes bacterium]|nr:hypothetical protein [Candidatus Hydrogenedentota bacterium]MBI3119428.1 hypothetical protein [Candidatus Hydrogenedentota bacterium]